MGTISRNKFGCNYLRNKKVFLNHLFSFLKSRTNVENFVKKDDPQSLCISEITDSERRE